MPRVESYASDECLLWFVIAREQEEDESERASAMELVAATSAFLGDWISPLSVSVRVESCDPNHYYFADSKHPPAHKAYFLRQRGLNDRLLIGQSWINSVEESVDRIDASALNAVVEEALAQPPPLEKFEIALADVEINATEVPLPDGMELVLSNGHTKLEPVSIREGNRLLAQGPDRSLFFGPPARVVASNMHGRTDIHVEFFWDIWRENPACFAQVRAAVERVLSRGRGWTIEQGNLPPAAS